MKQSTERVRTTHVGSLPRLAQVATPLRARERGETFDEQEFEASLRDVITSVVHDQVEAGIDCVNDGEQSKASFTNYLNARVTGFEFRSGVAVGANGTGASNWAGSRERLTYPGFYEWYGRQVSEPLQASGVGICTGPLAYTGHAAVQTDIANLKAAATAAGADEVFMTAVAAPTVASTRPNEYYRSEEEYLYALADVLRVEYEAIIEAGLVLQIDDPRFLSQYTMDPSMNVEDCRRWAAARMEVLNYSLRGLPEDRIRFHTCYSIDIGPRESDLELKDVVDIMLQINAGAYSFEAANPRHEHEYHVWEKIKLPPGKVLIPGMVSHTTHLVEHPELIAERITRFANLVGRERVIAGADCGFAATARTEPEIHPTVAWAKLRSLAKGAELASDDLWR